MDKQYHALLAAFERCPIIPVLTVDDSKVAGPLAEALYEAGLSTVEVTLRTPSALEVIQEMKNAVPRLYVGAGTILSETDIEKSIAAGSDFLVTPATSSRLLSAIKSVGLPTFPGSATPSEAFELYEHGFECVKFFPAESNGGTNALRSMAGPLPKISFMPTGGINAESAPDYLKLANVVAVGGSWMVDADALAIKDFAAVTAAAQEAVLAAC